MNICKINDHTDDQGKANAINTFFAQIGDKLARELPDIPFHSAHAHLPPIFGFGEIDKNEIMKIIKDLKPSNSASSDGLTTRIIKAAGPSIYQPLLHVINQSLISSSFATIWKLGYVTPLYKEGDRSDPSNYRHITILPAVGKLCERVAHSQLYGYCQDHNIISEGQSGFRKRHSTTSCLLGFLDNIFVQMDHGSACGVLFLDLRKAFDMVDHSILLAKLEHLGFCLSAVNWFESYLTGRKQVTKLNGKLCLIHVVTHGVPQG